MPMISDSTRELARDLIARGGELVDSIAFDAHEARALVRVSPEQAPVEFVVDLEGLQRFIGSAQQDARDVFPDADPTEGGLRLISVHLWEEVASADAQVITVGVDRKGEIWRRTAPASPQSAPTRGNYRWTADRAEAPGPDPQIGPQ
ncbi:hypothetical protein ACH47X_08080 [Promicromonospora kroppenstedtii]|uniref:Serine/threonine-protein kinase RsbW n=1 Tax=Promicromonospora kroppenstedtii TaxID=440482 RepID=A0ABW7XH69_9MICO